MFRLIYPLPLYDIAVFMVLSVVIWTVLMRMGNRLSERGVRIVNAVLAAAAVAVITEFTLFGRAKDDYGVILVPFHSFIEAREQKEIYRTMLMNVFLFTPFGLFTPFAVKRDRRKSVLITVVSAFVLSAAVEFIQFSLSTGRCETDDVLCNTLGAFIGSLSYLFFTL